MKRATWSVALAAASAAVIATGCAQLFHARGELASLHLREPKAAKVGTENCIDCHSSISGFYDSTVHKKEPGCETCHGPGDLHVSDGPGHIANAHDLQAMSPLGKSSMCTSCHADRRAEWPESEHARAGLTCFECHTDAVHFKQEGAPLPPSAYKDEPSAFCETCHANDVAQMAQPFRHPLAEGEVQCGDCHAIHGEDVRDPARRSTEACAKCHADEAGPKVFRHAALDEGCGTCHVTHGSTVTTLLREDGSQLCLSCHLEPGFPTIAGIDHADKLAAGAKCLDCHVEIHGSDSDPSLLGRIR